jgi:hypothetical protein
MGVLAKIAPILGAVSNGITAVSSAQGGGGGGNALQKMFGGADKNPLSAGGSTEPSLGNYASQLSTENASNMNPSLSSGENSLSGLSTGRPRMSGFGDSRFVNSMRR